jgi:hypothetical protein
MGGTFTLPWPAARQPNAVRGSIEAHPYLMSSLEAVGRSSNRRSNMMQSSGRNIQWWLRGDMRRRRRRSLRSMSSRASVASREIPGVVRAPHGWERAVERRTVGSGRWSAAPWGAGGGAPHGGEWAVERRTVGSGQWSAAPWGAGGGAPHGWERAVERRTVGSGRWIRVRPDGVDGGDSVPTALGAAQATGVVRTLQGRVRSTHPMRRSDSPPLLFRKRPPARINRKFNPRGSIAISPYGWHESCSWMG